MHGNLFSGKGARRLELVDSLLTFSKLRDVVHTIYEAVLHLPKPIRRVCIVSPLELD